MNVPPEDQAEQAEVLLNHYSFDLGGQSADRIVTRWTQTYEVSWLPLAVIEALYLGRYKAISVGQILAHWQRRDRPVYHFNAEFERLVCNNLPPHLTENVTGTEGGSTSQSEGQNNSSPEFNGRDRAFLPPLHYGNFYEKLKSLLPGDRTSEEGTKSDNKE